MIFFGKAGFCGSHNIKFGFVKEKLTNMVFFDDLVETCPVYVCMFGADWTDGTKHTMSIHRKL